MFKLNLASNFHREPKLTLRESLGSALDDGTAGAPWFSLYNPRMALAAALALGVIGGAVPGAVMSRANSSADMATVAPLQDKLQKLETDQTAAGRNLRTVGEANGALQTRIDQLEKRLSQIEQQKIDMTPTGAIESPAKPAKHKAPKP